MSIIEIERISSLSDEKGSYGHMFLDKQFVGYTVERPWMNNKKRQSCIPLGTYNTDIWNSAKFGQTIVLSNPALHVHATKEEEGYRSHILVHVANFPTELEGCIGVGTQWYKNRGQVVGVGQSRMAMKKLRSMWGDRQNIIVSITEKDNEGKS